MKTNGFGIFLSAVCFFSVTATGFFSCSSAVSSDGGGIVEGESYEALGKPVLKSSRSAPDITLGSGVEIGTRISYDKGNNDSANLTYITIAPIPTSVLFTDYLTGKPVSWTEYTITIKIDGKESLKRTIKPGDKAIAFERIPVGSKMMAEAEVKTSPVVADMDPLIMKGEESMIAEGSNAIPLYAQYKGIACKPLSPTSNTFPSGDFFTYTNKEPAVLPHVDEIWQVSGKKYYFAGWYTKSDYTGDFIPGPTLPAGKYKGKLSLYAKYEEQVYNEANYGSISKFVITSTTNLSQVLYMSLNGKDFSGKTIELNADVQINNTLAFKDFKGTFDGNNKTVTVQNIYGSAGGVAGLFESNSGTIKNIIFQGNIEITDGSAGMVGRNTGTIENCINKGTITVKTDKNFYTAGGIAGINSGTIKNCKNEGNVVCKSLSNVLKGNQAGAIAGINSGTGTVTGCSNTGYVNSENGASAPLIGN